MGASSSDAGAPRSPDTGPPGSVLWRRVVERTEHARACGALVSIASTCHTVEQAGMRFAVRLADALGRKNAATHARKQRGINPFLPYDEDLFVAEPTGTHVCLLNKFNVLDHHLLVITRDFEDQDELLTLRDFEALWACMLELDGLGFYNGGSEAGASQQHKHLQLVPGPLGQGPEPIPIEPAVRAARLTGPIGRLAVFRFAHAMARLEAPRDAGARAQESLELYLALRRAVGLAPGAPYNLLVTRSWMLVVPRSREHAGSIAVNALGFAGALLVRTREDLAVVERDGPLAVLERVTT